MVKLFSARIFSLVFLLLCTLTAFAQRPVQVIPSVMPPYSTLLSEYYSGTQPRLSVMLLNTDSNEPFLQVYLRMSIVGQGINLQSAPYGNYPTIDLMTGAMVTISQSDLAPYFNSHNLIGSTGLGQNRLPEGFYEFCFEVYEKNTNRLVGDKKCAQAYLTLSDPPILLLPEKTKAISYTNPFNLLFQWTARHLSNPNAVNTEYQFDLVEVWDSTIAPEAAFYTSKPVYSTKITTPNLFYGPGEPQLLTGKKYAWRVQAIVLNSNNEQEPFKNNGYSEIFWFKLQGACMPLQKATVVADPRTNKTTLSWITDPSNVGSTSLNYRKAGASKWTTVDAPTNQVTLTGLAWATNYEYQLGNRCVITDDLAYGSLQTFKTLTQDTANCVPSAPARLSNQNPIASLRRGDTIYASGFRMRLTQVSGANGQFSGQGYLALLVPTTTTEVSIRAAFQNIGVNTDKQLISGQIISLYDKTESGIGNIDPLTEGGIGTGDVKTGGTSITATVNTTIDPTVDAVVKVIGTGKDTSYTVTVTGVDGKPVSINTNKLPAVIQDNKGGIYSIDKNGKITKVGQSANPALLAGKGTDQLNQLATDKGKVIFDVHPDQVYAMDVYNKAYDKSMLFSQQYESLNQGAYRVANKLLVTNSSDKVLVKVSGLPDAWSADSIHYITAKNIELPATKRSDGNYEITLLAGPANDAQELYAVYRDNAAAKANTNASIKNDAFTYSLGKLKIATYEPKTLKVKLVPVDNAQVDKTQISTRLNQIYNPIGISWTVEVTSSFPITKDWDIDSSGSLNITGAGKYNQYSDEMKLLNTAYLQSNPNLDASSPYLFVFAASPTSGQDEQGRGVLGDMLRNKQFGYIFLPNNTDIGQTTAHELGHGVFHLNHTFDTQYYLSQGDLPTNLMDYSGGDQLNKLQWDAIYAPGLVIGVFEKEGDAELLVEIAQCLTGAGLDFTFYYTSIWITMQFDDAIADNLKPSFTDFTAVTNYKEFSWTEALLSAGITCAASTLPPFLAPETSRLMIIGCAALAGSATGFTTEMGKQYEISYASLKKPNHDPSMVEVIQNLNWTPIIVNTASTGIITGGVTWLATSPKFTVLVNRIQTKLSISNLATGKQKLVDYLSRKIGNTTTVVFKNVSFDDFAATIPTLNTNQKQLAYQLWGQNQWDDLYKLFNPSDGGNALNNSWPPFNGVKEITKVEKGNQLSGKVFDRFQNGDVLQGGFASPVYGNDDVGDLVFTYDSRALKGSIIEGTRYIKFKLTNPSASLVFEYGEAIPWFKIPGTADQIKSNIDFNTFDEGIDYEIVELLKYTNGKWIKIK